MAGREPELLPARGWAPPFAHGGRSPIVRGEVCDGAFVGRFELPKPCGARPRSVVFPCASQVRELFPGRCEPPLVMVLFVERFEFGIAEGGRFCDSSRCRGVIPELAGPLLGEIPERPFTLAVPLAAELPD